MILGNGSKEFPFDIRTGMSWPDIQSGHTVYLRGGVYDLETALSCTLQGTPDEPITIRNYPGEIAVLRGDVVQQPSGGYVRWLSEDYGLIIDDTLTERTSTETPTVPGQHSGLYANNIPGMEFINVRIHNVPGTGISWFLNGGGQAYGVVITDNGWVGSDRPHGPSVYTSCTDAADTKTFRNCLFLNSFRHVQVGAGDWCYGTFVFEDITVANRAFTSGNRFNKNLSVERLFIHNGHPCLGLYIQEDEVAINGVALIKDCVIDPYLHDPYGAEAFYLKRWEQATVTGNVFTVDDWTNIELPGGVYDIQEVVATTTGQFTNFVPNEYAPGFASLTVFDFDETGAVAVDVSALAESGTVRVRNPMLWDDEYQDIAVVDGMLTVPMTDWTTPAPIGFETPFVGQVFSARFGAWILETL